jgi:VanZ family protein
MHQLLIDGRSGQWTDVLLDSAGVLAGVMIAGEIIRKTEQKKGRK